MSAQRLANQVSSFGPVSCGVVPEAVLVRNEPCVLRGLVSHWPLVQAASKGPEQALAVLRAHWHQATVGVFRMAPQTRGRIAYLSDFSGFNFSREFMPFGHLLDELQALSTQDEPQTLYMGSTTLDACLPGLRASHALQLQTPEEPLVSLWLGNRVGVPAHQDWPSNLACCVAGQRHFTLYPPDAVGDLYIGPLEFTPAGQPISLVDAAEPDLSRFPRFAAAQARALNVTLEPGDAIFIPSLWWHQVESSGPLGALINYWWRRSPAWLDSPTQALWLAMALVRDLPAPERQAWRALFDHYVFEADERTAAHLPEPARGLLSPLSEVSMRRLRALLLNKLNR
jgi:hypothetical protein